MDISTCLTSETSVESVSDVMCSCNPNPNPKKYVLIFIIVNVYEARMRTMRENRQGDSHACSLLATSINPYL